MADEQLDEKSFNEVMSFVTDALVGIFGHEVPQKYGMHFSLLVIAPLNGGNHMGTISDIPAEHLLECLQQQKVTVAAGLEMRKAQMNEKPEAQRTH